MVWLYAYRYTTESPLGRGIQHFFPRPYITLEVVSPTSECHMSRLNELPGNRGDSHTAGGGSSAVPGALGATL